MDFFTATTVAHDGHITTPSHGTLPAALAQTPAGAGEAVDAFAEAINARYSRASTLLIPLSPNQGPLTGPTLATAVGGAPSSLTQTHNGQQASQVDGPPRPPPPPILPALALPEKVTRASNFSLTMPARPPVPPLSLSAPPSAAAVPKLTLPSAPVTAPLPSSTASTSTTTPPVTAPTTATSTLPAPASSFPPVLPSALAPILADANTLILDIRPHNAYALARLPTALSLSVPSTLLKRPLFSLARLAQMLASPTARARFSAYASYARIVVYDADSGVLAEGGNLLGLMRKFRKEGYEGEVCWVKGGFHAVWRENKECVVRDPPVEEEEDEDAEEANATVGPLPSIDASSSHPTGANVLRTKHLPMAAFTSSSTTTRGFRLFVSG